jgi:hypothetical protein
VTKSLTISPDRELLQIIQDNAKPVETEPDQIIRKVEAGVDENFEGGAQEQKPVDKLPAHRGEDSEPNIMDISEDGMIRRLSHIDLECMDKNANTSKVIDNQFQKVCQK